MLLHGINDNILISHPSSLGVYQYDAKNKTLQRDNLGEGWNQTPKTDKTKVHVTHAIMNI